MATMTESSTDKRVDDLRVEMHRGFDQVDADIRELRSEARTGNATLRADMKAGDESVKEGFAAVDARFDWLQRMMIGFFATTLGSIIAGVVLLFVSHH